MTRRQPPSGANPAAGEPSPDRRQAVTLAQAFPVWLRIAALSFGGPAGQIAVMHRILVEERRWIGEQRFLHALSYCTLLPGPEAQQLATYIGWLMNRTAGGLMAGILFILPGFLSILALSYLYVLFGEVPMVLGLFFGLKAAVLALVVQALLRIGRRALSNRLTVAIAVAAFLCLALFRLPFPLIVAAAGLVGLAGGLLRPQLFAPSHAHAAGAGLPDAASLLGETLPRHARPRPGWSLMMLVILATLWLGPVLALHATLGPQDIFTRLAIFFSKMAVVTFGGAYAVLSYVAQQAVDTYHWLTPGEILDGLGMAETTPGPLIQVVQFVGFLGAYRLPGALSPLTAATLAALLVTWVTYVPCFLWIFLGAPYVEQLRGNRAVAGALSAITAAVVGVILNLAVWFGLHVLFATVTDRSLGPLRLDLPALSSLKLPSLMLAVAAAVLLFRFRLSPMLTLLVTAAAGIVWTLALP